MVPWNDTAKRVLLKSYPLKVKLAVKLVGPPAATEADAASAARRTATDADANTVEAMRPLPTASDGSSVGWFDSGGFTHAAAPGRHGRRSLGRHSTSGRR